MQFSKGFVILGLVAIAALAIWGWNIQTVIGSSHYVNPYPYNGWPAIASVWDGTIPWALDPNFPTTNVDGHNIRDGLRYAMSKWQPLRNGGYSNYSYETFWSGETPPEGYYHYNNSTCSLCGTLLWRYVSGACNLTEGAYKICKVTSTLNPNISLADGSLTAFRGALAHEMGHALGSLGHPDTEPGPPNCQSIMSWCWQYIDTPTAYDEESMDLDYGLPCWPRLDYDGDTTRGHAWAYDCSSYDLGLNGYKFTLWKWNSSLGQWEIVHDHFSTAIPGDTVNLYETIVQNHGCGYYLYGIWARNSYPDGVNADQFGGFTNSLYFC